MKNASYNMMDNQYCDWHFFNAVLIDTVDMNYLKKSSIGISRTCDKP